MATKEASPRHALNYLADEPPWWRNETYRARHAKGRVIAIEYVGDMRPRWGFDCYVCLDDSRAERFPYTDVKTYYRAAGDAQTALDVHYLSAHHYRAAG